MKKNRIIACLILILILILSITLIYVFRKNINNIMAKVNLIKISSQKAKNDEEIKELNQDETELEFKKLLTLKSAQFKTWETVDEYGGVPIEGSASWGDEYGGVPIEGGGSYVDEYGGIPIGGSSSSGGGVNYSNYDYVYYGDANDRYWDHWYIPYGTYCIEPGAHINHDYGPLAYNVVGTYPLPVAAAYILSVSGTTWQQKQLAIWRLRNYSGLNLNEDGRRLIETDSTSKYDEGQSDGYGNTPHIYSIYHTNIKQNGYTKIDNTVKSNVTSEVTNNKYKVGPFNITYTEDVSSSNGTKLNVAGIKSVTLLGLDSNKQFVANVSISAIKVNNSSISATNIPSNQDFYIEFNAPSNTKIAYIQLKVVFKYKLASGTYKKLNGVMGNGERAQSLMIPTASFNENEEIMELEPIEIIQSIEGNVWVDGLVTQGKEAEADGKNNTTNDISLPNIKVTLYSTDGKIATLKTNPKESGLSRDKIMNRINPTYTDKNGNYKFEGLESNKNYYVVFEYDGQMYLPTKKITPEAENTSKGMENENERTAFNNKFGEIRSYPENYQTSNSLEKSLGTYNKVYSQYDLMGYTLDENGKYKKTGTQLVDGYLYDENGNQTTTYAEGQISTKLLEYIYTNKVSPDIKTIYTSIAGSNTEIWRMLQFIEDCKIKSYIDNFNTDSKYKDYINQGLWRRQEEKLILTKDVLYGATRVNGKTELYQYDNRNPESNSWEIQTRMQNYAQYYAGAYENGIYKTDYTYDGSKTNGGSDLEVYITYRITIKNISNSLVNQITEVVDYYDKNYTFVKDLSWVMYDKVNLKQEDYYNMIDSLNLSKIPNTKSINSSSTSKYGGSTHQDVTNNMDAVYIKGLENKKIGIGESEYIYLTFKVKENTNGIILNDYTNYAEINGYKTFYANGITLPNKSTITNNTTVAGIIDQKSTPGNLTSSDLIGTKYEKNFENDTDRAVGISIKLTKQDRKLNGYAWEDLRNIIVDNASIGNGLRDNEEKGVAGITVQLVEKLLDGKEYLWKTTMTDNNGYYEFDGVVCGEYVIRFIYGNNKNTVLATYNNGISYNGQDYKSTVYQKDMIAKKDIEKEYYDIALLDGYGKNLSDAKDLWADKTVTIKQANGAEDQIIKLQGRQTVNNYSSVLNNKISEVLASPYKEDATEDEINELVTKTQMVAETAIIKIEGEKNATISIGKSSGVGTTEVNSKNGNYVLANIDFGLVERPKAQLELNKNVEHIKVTLANKNVLFDTKQATNNLIWQKAEKYNIDTEMQNNKYNYSYTENVLGMINRDNGIIQITMDEEIMHGATIEITYKISVKNCSEIDYIGKDFYYKGTVTTDSKLVTITPTRVIDYVSNNLQYKQDENIGWTALSGEELKNKGIVSNNLNDSLEKINVILETTEYAAVALEPGKEKEQTLKLTQIITPGSQNDDLTYENIAEIVEVANTAGRRMAFSELGAQDPLLKANQVSSSNSEQVVILPPFGSEYLYIGLGVFATAILAGGVILIKKKVLKK